MTSFFDENKVLRYFRNVLSQGTLYRTCLFLMPSQKEQSDLIKKVAALLLCQAAEEPPCGKCVSCTKAVSGNHPDIILVERHEKKNISMEQIREMIYESSIKPWEGRYKIFLLPNVGSLREDAANALLKTLEEPSEHCIFLMTAENEADVLDTILSRCQIFPIGYQKEKIVETLMQDYGIEKSKAIAASCLSESGLAGALYLLQEKWQERTTLFERLLQRDDPVKLGEEIAEKCGTGEEGRQKSWEWIVYLTSFWHDVLVCQYLPPDQKENFILNRDFAGQIEYVAQHCSTARIHKILEFLFSARTMLDFNVNLSLIWENIFLQI